MAPQTRKRKSSISYVEEPDSQEDVFEQTFDLARISKSSQSDSESDYQSHHRSKRGRKSKRRRQNSRKPSAYLPSPPELSDEEIEICEEPDSTISTSRGRVTSPQVAPSTITLRLPVHLRDTNIALNLSDILELNLANRSDIRINSDGTLSSTPIKPNGRCLISSLPTEIRVRILRCLLVTNAPIQFASRQGFERSAHVLRLSRVFHDDGTQILYGENCFHFERTAACRGKYWEAQWNEVGFKDVRRFLHDIGENKKKLKYVSIRCMDAVPTDTPLLTVMERKFVNDAVLLDCFKMIADNTVLERFAIGLHGRALIAENDRAFLRALTRIKCYELTFTQWFGEFKIGEDIMDKIRKLVELPARDLTTKRKVLVKMAFEHAKRLPLSAKW